MQGWRPEVGATGKTHAGAWSRLEMKRRQLGAPSRGGPSPCHHLRVYASVRLLGAYGGAERLRALLRHVVHAAGGGVVAAVARAVQQHGVLALQQQHLGGGGAHGDGRATRGRAGHGAG